MGPALLDRKAEGLAGPSQLLVEMDAEGGVVVPLMPVAMPVGDARRRRGFGAAGVDLIEIALPRLFAVAEAGADGLGLVQVVVGARLG